MEQFTSPVVIDTQRGGQQRFKPHRAEGGRGEGCRLVSAACGSWLETITSIAPLATPSTIAARSASERSGGFTLRKV